MKRKTRILLLTQWFDPEPTFKGMVFARELVKQGFAVEVLTGFPNYPGGKLYSGYRITWLQREEIDGINIYRVPMYPSHNQSAFQRAANYISFAISALIYGFFIVRRVDVIYAYHPPLTVGVTAGLLRLFHRIPVVYDVQDMWPDTLRATSMISNSSLLRIVDAVCLWVYRNVDHIVVLSPGFKRLLVQRGVPEKKIGVIYNWADEAALLRPMVGLPVQFTGNDRFYILFAGNIGKAQALDAVLGAAKLLQARSSRVCFALIGGGVEVLNLKRKAEELGLGNIYFYPPVPMAEVGAYLNAADVLLVHLRKDPLFAITIPSKTQAYMAVGKPLLMAVDGDAAQLVYEANCGLIAKSEDPVELARVAETFSQMSRLELNKMAENGRRYYQTHLSLQVGVRCFAEAFTRLTDR